jgi:hypothetical protein
MPCTTCGRPLYVEEKPRGVCVRCAYWFKRSWADALGAIGKRSDGGEELLYVTR